MKKRESLIRALRISAKALKNDTVHYEWTKQHSCNCGVLAQALTGMHKIQLEHQTLMAFSTRQEGRPHTDPIPFEKNENPTWKSLVKQKCSITGEPMCEILSILFSKGLTTDDIVHLEYMENPAILERAGISKNPVKVKTAKIVEEEVVIKRGFLGIGRKVEKSTKTVYETKTQNYYSVKENLIKYLSAWAEILEEEVGEKNLKQPFHKEKDKNRLHEMLLIATSEENYELAAELRDRIEAIK